MNITKPIGQRVSVPRNTVTWLLIGVLFFLRIVLAGLIPTLMKNPPEWANAAYEVGTYLAIVILIWWERENLAEFFIDKLALVVLMLGKPYELLLHWLKIPFEYPPQSDIYRLYIPIAFGLLVIFLFIHPKLRKIEFKNWLWLLAGIAAGIVSGILAGYLLRYQFPGGTEKPTLSLLLFLPTQQLVYAGITEEPFFRGFLWGGLHRAGWKGLWILLFQTVLFMIGHLYYFGSLPLSFWIIVPLAGLVTGMFAWRSRSIATSMAAHGFFNAVAQIVAFYRF
jgi:membrane protease YdiL (CAAX protease family)